MAVTPRSNPPLKQPKALTTGNRLDLRPKLIVLRHHILKCSSIARISMYQRAIVAAT